MKLDIALLIVNVRNAIQMFVIVALISMAREGGARKVKVKGAQGL